MIAGYAEGVSQKTYKVFDFSILYKRIITIFVNTFLCRTFWMK